MEPHRTAKRVTTGAVRVSPPVYFPIDATGSAEVSFVNRDYHRPRRADPLSIDDTKGTGVTEINSQNRNMVFVSHANPEDNAFAQWLALRLATQGYAVWSDVTRLLGGEDFWDDIQ